MTPFLEASTFRQDNDETFVGEISDDWRQGKGAFGGLQLAIALRAMQRVAGDDRRPLVLQAHYCAPCRPGPATLQVRVARRGRRVVTLEGRIVQGETCTTLVSGTFGAAQAHRLSWLEESPPDAAPLWRDTPAAPWMEPMPTFLRHFAVRFLGGSLPYTGGALAEVNGWVGLRPEEAVAWDGPAIAAAADVYPPAAIGKADGFVPAATISLQVTFTADPRAAALREDEPVFVDVKAPWAGEGYSENHTSLWTPGGALVARCHQVFAILG